MLCFEAWCGALPTSLVGPTKLQVFSKLGGNFLGFVTKPCLERLDDVAKAYTTLRDMQAQAALLLKHDYLPPRYLAFCVGSKRLTSPSFPFADSLDQEQVGLLGALLGAERIDVMYDGDTDVDVAKASLIAKSLNVVHSSAFDDSVDDYDLRVGFTKNQVKLSKLVQPELDVFAFKWTISRLEFNTSADSIGDLVFFPYLVVLRINGVCCVKNSDLASLASTCKLLKHLSMHLDGSTSSLMGISKLSNLEYLEVSADLPDLGRLVIPREVGHLSKLTALIVRGQQVVGQIPSEIGQLQRLETLDLSGTNLTSCIPTEFGNLSQLLRLYLANNKYLDGQLPQETNKLSKLMMLSLDSTPNVCTSLFKLRGIWHKEGWWCR